jgi:hypothetical protein
LWEEPEREPEPLSAAIVDPPEEPVLAEDELPELIAPEEAALEALPPPVPVEPCAAAPPPLGVPVVPIGVFCELRWPAPTAGLLEGVGGVPWAKARPTVAAAKAAMRILDVDIQGLLWFVGTFDRHRASQPRVRSRR